MLAASNTLAFLLTWSHLSTVLPWHQRRYHGSPAQASYPATGDQPRRVPDPLKTSPQRIHARVPDRCLTALSCYEKTRLTVPIVYPSRTRRNDALANNGTLKLHGEVFEAVPERAVLLERRAQLLGSCIIACQANSSDFCRSLPDTTS